MSMSKIEAIRSVMTLSEYDARTLIEIAKKPFCKPESDVQNLLNHLYIEKSGDGYITTDSSDVLLEEAADLWAKNQPVVEKKARGVRKAREITDEMTEHMNLAQKLLEQKWKVRNVTINRQNYEIKLDKCTPEGFRQFEVRNNGVFRIFGYKVSDYWLNRFEEIGCEYRDAAPNFYIDIPCTVENIEKLIATAQDEVIRIKL